MNRAYLSIGSNIEPERHVRAGVAALAKRYGELIISPVYQNPAMGFDGDDFYNLVIGLDTAASAEQLAAACREIETAHGRRRTDQRFSDRTLDIDLLTLGNAIREDVPILPRDEILKYAFVLKPLADIAPEERHPVDGRRYADIWAQFEGEGVLRRVAIDFSAETGS